MSKFTAKDIIEYLEEIAKVVYGERYGEAYCEAIDEAIKVVKKTIPQKVTHEATLYKCCTCPNCKNVVDKFTDFLGEKVRVRIKYCNFCG